MLPFQVYLSLGPEAEREIAKMAVALEALRAASAANPDSDGFAQGQLTNEMYRRTAELKASVSAAFLRLL